MNSFEPAIAVEQRRGPLGRLGRWLDSLPHPDLVFEIEPQRVAAARWGSTRLDAFAEEALPPGTIRPSASQPNFTDGDAVARAVAKVANRVRGAGREAALLVPDAVVRVFLLGFESFPRKVSEAIPLLRWRLKKSVPFPVEETVLSWAEQRAAGGGLEVASAVARESVLREYEQALERAGLDPGVVLGSTLAALPLVEDGPATLLVRLAGASLNTAIVHGGRLALYRCTDWTAGSDPQAVLGEIFPSIAYFQDNSKRNLERVLLAGLDGGPGPLRSRLEKELGCSVASLGGVTAGADRLPGGAGELVSKQWESLVGWCLNRGA